MRDFKIEKKDILLPEAQIIKATVESVRKRALPEGGFAMHNGEAFRPDATAWAVMALVASEGDLDLTIPACRQLAGNQQSDGRISVVDGHLQSYWPTSLAILAWKKVAGFEQQREWAARFLLNNTGKHWPKEKDSAAAHDTSIKGWPWIEGTYSWIEPTALAILALRSSGFSGHSRVKEAVRMILDRQLPSGGWNYGNKIVFKKELRPMPAYTGMALTALAGLSDMRQIRLSLDYLTDKVQKLQTPLSLAWSIFGITAWSKQPDNLHDLILKSLYLQKKYGSYNTELLSQLLFGYFTDGDFIGFLE